MIQFDRGVAKLWTMAKKARSEEWNERETKKSGINEELKQIQLISGQENDRDCRMRRKRIQKVCDNPEDLVAI
jgi:hypothetical protein